MSEEDKIEKIFEKMWRFVILFLPGPSLKAQPKAGTGLEMQTVRFFNVTLLGINR